MQDRVQPLILEEGKYTLEQLDKLKSMKLWGFRDIYKSQLRETFEIKNPGLINSEQYPLALDEFVNSRVSPDGLCGNYVYFPWSGLLFHMLPHAEYYDLRTNRTSHLITEKEKEILKNFNAGIAGLSFGNGIALALIYSGISSNIKVADTDIFETTNLNRVRVGLPSVELKKTVVTAQEIYEIDPYAEVSIFDKGLNDDNLNDFIFGMNKLDIVFDVVDDFSMKVKLRLEAKKAKIPVVMLTSLEDSILVDIERFDLHPEADIFHGLLGDITDDLLHKKMSESDKAKYAMKIVGPEHISFRNFKSLSEVGNTLVSRPHLYGTVNIVCGLAAYITKRIALSEDMPSLRKHIKFNEVLNIQPNHGDTQEARDKFFKKLINS